MSELRFSSGVTWERLGAYRRPESTEPEALRRQLQDWAYAASRPGRVSTVDFMRVATELAKTNPREAMKLADEFIFAAGGGWRMGHGPNDLMAIYELKGEALASGMSGSDLNGYSNVLMAVPQMPPAQRRAKPEVAAAYGRDESFDERRYRGRY